MNDFASMFTKNIIVDVNLPPGQLLILSPRYKNVVIEKGETPKMQTVLDMEATARASILITGIGGIK